MNNTSMYIIHDKLRHNREVNRENKRFYISSDADKKLFQLLKKIRKAKYDFEMHCMSSKQDSKTPYRIKVDAILSLYSEWYSAVAEALLYIEHCCPGGGLYIPDQTISEGIYNEVMNEANAFKTQKIFRGHTSEHVENIDTFLNEIKNPPVQRDRHSVKFLTSLDNTWKNQLQMLDAYYEHERHYKSNGEYTRPIPRDNARDQAFRQSFTKQFSKMFTNLIETLNLFNSIANKSINYEEISMNDVDDLKILVENIEQLKDFLDEKNLQIVNEVFPSYKQRFMKDYEKFREKNNEAVQHKTDDFDVK